MFFPISGYSSTSTKLTFSDEDKKLLRAAFERVEKRRTEAESSSSTTNPIGLSGSDSTSRSGSTGDAVNFNPKSISADDIQKQLQSREFNPTFRNAENEFNQLIAKCQELRSELSKVIDEYKKEKDTAKINDLAKKETELKEQIAALDKAIKAYETLVKQGINGIEPGKTDQKLIEKNREALTAITTGLNDPNLQKLGLSTGNMQLTAKKAAEYREKQIEGLSEKSDNEAQADLDRTGNSGATGAATSTTPRTEQQIAISKRQAKRAEQAGDIDGQIEAQKAIISALETADEKAKEEYDAKIKEIKEKIEILNDIIGNKGISKVNWSIEYSKRIYKLMEKYQNGFEIKSTDGKTTIKVSATDVKANMAFYKRLIDTNTSKTTNTIKFDEPSSNSACKYGNDEEFAKSICALSPNQIIEMAQDQIDGNETYDNDTPIDQMTGNVNDWETSIGAFCAQLVNLKVSRGTSVDDLSTKEREFYLALYNRDGSKKTVNSALLEQLDKLSEKYDVDDRGKVKAFFQEWRDHGGNEILNAGKIRKPKFDLKENDMIQEEHYLPSYQPSEKLDEAREHLIELEYKKEHPELISAKEILQGRGIEITFGQNTVSEDAYGDFIEKVYEFAYHNTYSDDSINLGIMKRDLIANYKKMCEELDKDESIDASSRQAQKEELEKCLKLIDTVCIYGTSLKDVEAETSGAMNICDLKQMNAEFANKFDLQITPDNSLDEYTVENIKQWIYINFDTDNTTWKEQTISDINGSNLDEETKQKLITVLNSATITAKEPAEPNQTAQLRPRFGSITTGLA